MNAFIKAATIAVVSLSLLSVGACAKKKVKGDEESSGSSTYGTEGGPSGTGASGSVVGAPSETGGGGIPSTRVVYFEFDSSELNQQGQATVEAWAAYLSANGSAKVRLEGHADERGTREYNVGLGERRANAVAQALTSRGVSDRQISVSSFGEERPVQLGHDEAAWAQNRRVEFAQ